MKISRGILLFIVMVLLFACHNKTGRKKQLGEFRKGFKQVNLKKFAIPNVDWGQLGNHYTYLDSTNIDFIWGAGPKANYLGDSAFCYSWQRSGSTLNTFSVIVWDESDYCYNIEMITCDSTGHFIGHMPLASQCGDGGWGFNAWSKQQSTNIYQYTSVETNLGDEDTTKHLMYIYGDSIVSNYSIMDNGVVSVKEVSKTKIVKSDTVLAEEPSDD